MSRTSSVVPQHIVLTRALLFILGCGAIWWGAVVLPVFRQQSSANHIAERIISGEPFKLQTLSEQLSILAASKRPTVCRPVALQSAAIIQLRIAEPAGGGLLKDESHLGLVEDAIRSSLSCVPADPFLWLVFFAVQNAKNGFNPEHMKYLRMSYDLGPNEGWILAKRSPVAIAELERLPPDLAGNAIHEFLRLVDSWYYKQAVDIFCRTTTARRDKILPKLVTLPLRVRNRFADSVDDCGLDVKVPGVESVEPWKR